MYITEILYCNSPDGYNCIVIFREPNIITLSAKSGTSFGEEPETGFANRLMPSGSLNISSSGSSTIEKV